MNGLTKEDQDFRVSVLLDSHPWVKSIPLRPMFEDYDDAPDVLTFPCDKCGTEISRHKRELSDEWHLERCYLKGFYNRRCARCEAEWEAAEKKREEEERIQKNREERESKWRKDICPRLYYFTEHDHPSMPKDVVKYIREEWDMFGGIGLVGVTGKCKTRLGFLALYRAHMDEKHVEAINHTDFVSLVQVYTTDPEDEDAKRRMRRIHGCDVLLFDDIGKMRTERSDAELYRLIEHRYAHDLTTIWTANSGPITLRKMFGTERGPAIVRRLTEESQVFTLK